MSEWEGLGGNSGYTITAVGTRPRAALQMPGFHPPVPRGQNGQSCTEEIRRRPHYPWQRNNTVNLPNSSCCHAVGQGRGPTWPNRKPCVMLLIGIYLQFLCSCRESNVSDLPRAAGTNNAGSVSTAFSGQNRGCHWCRRLGRCLHFLAGMLWGEGGHRLRLSPSPFCPSLSQRTAYSCSDVSSAVALENCASPGCGY